MFVLMNVVCCQVLISAIGRSQVQRDLQSVCLCLSVCVCMSMCKCVVCVCMSVCECARASIIVSYLTINSTPKMRR